MPGQNSYLAIFRLPVGGLSRLGPHDRSEEGVRTRGLDPHGWALLGFLSMGASPGTGLNTKKLLIASLRSFLAARTTPQRGEVFAALRTLAWGRRPESLAVGEGRGRVRFVPEAGRAAAIAYLECRDPSAMLARACFGFSARGALLVVLDFVEAVVRADLGAGPRALLATARAYLRGELSRGGLQEGLQGLREPAPGAEQASGDPGVLEGLGIEEDEVLLEPQVLARLCVEEAVAQLPPADRLKEVGWLWHLPSLLEVYASVRLLGGVTVTDSDMLASRWLPRGSWAPREKGHQREVRVMRALAEILSDVLPLGKVLLLHVKEDAR